jgi:hypothetical protein
MLRLATTAVLASLVVCPHLVKAQSVAFATPTDFAVAAAACMEAVASDKLETDKLTSSGWKKQGVEKIPLGEYSVLQSGAQGVRILAGSSPSSFCFADGYIQSADQFDAVSDLIGKRLKAAYGTTGQTDVASGKPGETKRRQGFLVANAVAGLSLAQRPTGLALRFTAVAKKFSGNPASFQTSRPPLSEAEMAENRAEERAAGEFAKTTGGVQELLAMASDCAAALRGDGALPGDGWQMAMHASGSPRGMEALKKRDANGMMAAMAQTRKVMFKTGRRGLVTKYFVRGVTSVCEATIYVDPALLEVTRTEAASVLALGKDSAPSRKAADFAGEYMVTDLDRTNKWGQSEVAFHQGFGSSLDRPDSGKTSLSIFIF